MDAQATPLLTMTKASVRRVDQCSDGSGAVTSGWAWNADSCSPSRCWRSSAGDAIATAVEASGDSGFGWPSIRAGPPGGLGVPVSSGCVFCRDLAAIAPSPECLLAPNSAIQALNEIIIDGPGSRAGYLEYLQAPLAANPQISASPLRRFVANMPRQTRKFDFLGWKLAKALRRKEIAYLSPAEFDICKSNVNRWGTPL